MGILSHLHTPFTHTMSLVSISKLPFDCLCRSQGTKHIHIYTLKIVYNRISTSSLIWRPHSLGCTVRSAYAPVSILQRALQRFDDEQFVASPWRQSVARLCVSPSHQTQANNLIYHLKRGGDAKTSVGRPIISCPHVARFSAPHLADSLHR